MIKRCSFVVSLVAAAAAVSASVASAQARAVPKPSEGHKALEYFVGTWRTDGYMNQNPLSPAGKVTGTISCELFTGGYHVVCQTDANYPIGPLRMLGAFHYNPGEKIYMYFAIDSQGMGGAAKGTMTEPGTWVYGGEGKIAGKVTRSRSVTQIIGADSYTFKWEIAVDDGPYTTILEGTNTRVKASS